MLGLPLIVSPYALKDGDVRLFPASKNRSKRIHKKLVKRHGGEFKKVPAIWRTEDHLIVHPALMHTLRQAIAESRKEPSLDNNVFEPGLPPLPKKSAPPSPSKWSSGYMPLLTGRPSYASLMA